MNRKQRNWAFWILVFSLGMVPLAASGASHDRTSEDYYTSKKDVNAPVLIGWPPSAGQLLQPAAAPATPAPPAKPAVKKPAAKKPTPKPTAKPAATAAVDPMSARVTALETSVKGMSSSIEEIKKAVTHPADASAKPATLTSAQVAPTEAAAGVATSDGRPTDLSSGDMKNTFLDFEASIEGSRPESRATLMGRVYEDCKDYFTVTHGNSEPFCGGNAFIRIADAEGRGRECMAKHKANPTEKCIVGNNCVFLSELPGGTWALERSGEEVGTTEIQLAHRNPSGNERSKIVCESFPNPEKMRHIGTTTIVERAQDAVENAKAKQLQSLNRQMSNCKTPEDIAIARQANEVLAAMGAYGEETDAIQKRNAKKIDEKELALIRGRASHAKADELDAIAQDLNAYASAHPNQCKKLVESYRNLARKFVAKSSPKKSSGGRRHRGDDEDSDDDASDPLAGYDSAQDMIGDSACYDESDKLAEMSDNLEMNRVEKEFEMGGMSSMEARTDYYNLAQRMNENTSEMCTGWNVGMECASAMKNMQTVSTLPQYGIEADRRRMQSQIALQQLMQQYSGGNMYGASAMNGMGNLGGVGGFQGSASGGSFGFGRL